LTDKTMYTANGPPNPPRCYSRVADVMGGR